MPRTCSLQATAVQKYATLLADTLPTTSAKLGSLSTAISNSPIDFASASDTLVALQQRLTTSGFTSAEISDMTALGLNSTDIAQLRSVLTETAAANPNANYTLDSYQTYGSPTAIIPSLQAAEQTTATDAAQLAADMGPIISTLRSEITAPNLPTASAGGPYTGTVGTAVSFDAGGSTTPAATGELSYAWDLTGAGTFTDATGPTPTFTYTAPYVTASSVSRSPTRQEYRTSLIHTSRSPRAVLGRRSPRSTQPGRRST